MVNTVINTIIFIKLELFFIIKIKKESTEITKIASNKTVKPFSPRLAFAKSAICLAKEAETIIDIPMPKVNFEI